MRSVGAVTARAEVAARVSTLCSRPDFLTSPLRPLSQGQTLSLDEAAAAAFVQRRSYNERIARVYRLGTFSSNVQERIATRLMVQFIISRVDYSS